MKMTPAPESATASTVEKQSNLKPWPKGVSGNPAGRAKGSRNRIVQAVTDIYTASLDEHGEETLEAIRQKDPSTYMRLAMQFVPKKVESLLTQHVSVFQQYNLTDPREFAQAWEIARQVVYGQAPIEIEHESERRDAEYTDAD
jgi:hypothetical protein